MAWLWLIIRLYAGWEWLNAGFGKITSPVWTGPGAGTALTGFVNGALNKTAGANPDVNSIYAGFLQTFVLPHAAVWSWATALREVVLAWRVAGWCRRLVGTRALVLAVAGNSMVAGSTAPPEPVGGAQRPRDTA